MSIMPKALLDRPSLSAGNRPYLAQFYELCAGRSTGEFPQALLGSEIYKYMDEMGLRGDMRDVFMGRIRALDSAYLDHMRKKLAAK